MSVALTLLRAHELQHHIHRQHCEEYSWPTQAYRIKYMVAHRQVVTPMSAEHSCVVKPMSEQDRRVVRPMSEQDRRVIRLMSEEHIRVCLLYTSPSPRD